MFDFLWYLLPVIVVAELVLAFGFWNWMNESEKVPETGLLAFVSRFVLTAVIVLGTLSVYVAVAGA
ncbi:hypothetical protein OB920_05365 [Halobacteria archaeon HArc-gm2]|mgnify:CR=1 FL=1|nr:hypothetical protein [Halobacteria archaeon HArc-gm2]